MSFVQFHGANNLPCQCLQGDKHSAQCWHDGGHVIEYFVHPLFALKLQVMFSRDVKDIYEVQLQVLGFELDLDVCYFFPHFL